MNGIVSYNSCILYIKSRPKGSVTYHPFHDQYLVTVYGELNDRTHLVEKYPDAVELLKKLLKYGAYKDK